jgi:hypothetical protein
MVHLWMTLVFLLPNTCDIPALPYPCDALAIPPSLVMPVIDVTPPLMISCLFM